MGRNLSKGCECFPSSSSLGTDWTLRMKYLPEDKVVWDEMVEKDIWD